MAVGIRGVPRLPDMVEPRCRVCRDPHARQLVNALLDRRQQLDSLRICESLLGEGTLPAAVTYRAVLEQLEPINSGRPQRDRITYDSLWVHAKRHHEWPGITARWGAWLTREMQQRLRLACSR